MNARIKRLRKALDLTQQDFATKIGSTQNVLANYESGRRNPSSSVVNNICKTFNADETWLRTGKGEMFNQPQNREEDIQRMVEQMMKGRNAEYKRRMLSVLTSLDEDQWEVLLDYLRKILDDRPAELDTAGQDRTEPDRQRTIEEEARAEAEQHTQQIYEQILAEKIAAAGLSSKSTEQRAGGGTAKQA